MKQTLTLFLSIISLLAISCGGQQDNQSLPQEKPAVTVHDSLTAADESAIIDFLRQNIDSTSICGVSLSYKTTDIKRLFHFRPQTTASTCPRIAFGRFGNKRLAWGLGLVMDKPFGTMPNATPRQIILEISLSDEAAKNNNVILKHVAEFLHIQPDTWQQYHDGWIHLSVKSNNIHLILSDTQGDSQQDAEDPNTFDFS